MLLLQDLYIFDEMESIGRRTKESRDSFETWKASAGLICHLCSFCETYIHVMCNSEWALPYPVSFEGSSHTGLAVSPDLGCDAVVKASLDCKL